MESIYWQWNRCTARLVVGGMLQATESGKEFDQLLLACEYCELEDTTCLGQYRRIEFRWDTDGIQMDGWVAKQATFDLQMENKKIDFVLQATNRMNWSTKVKRYYLHLRKPLVLCLRRPYWTKTVLALPAIWPQWEHIYAPTNKHSLENWTNCSKCTDITIPRIHIICAMSHRWLRKFSIESGISKTHPIRWDQLHTCLGTLWCIWYYKTDWFWLIPLPVSEECEKWEISDCICTWFDHWHWYSPKRWLSFVAIE